MSSNKKSEELEERIYNCAVNYIIYSILTAVNVIMVLIGVGMSLSFSGFLPTLLAELSVTLKQAIQRPDMANVYMVCSISLTVIYIATAILLKKRSDLIFIPLTLTAVDTIVLVIFIVTHITNMLYVALYYMLTVLFHIWIMYYLISGAISVKKLNYLPDDSQICDTDSEVSDNNGSDDTENITD